MTADIPTRSPWLEQLRHGDPPRPLDRDLATDVAVVGAGIAGASTASSCCATPTGEWCWSSAARIGHGATGHNAGQLATYFERALSDLVDEFGIDMAIDAQRGVDSAWDAHRADGRASAAAPSGSTASPATWACSA